MLPGTFGSPWMTAACVTGTVNGAAAAVLRRGWGRGGGTFWGCPAVTCAGRLDAEREAAAPGATVSDVPPATLPPTSAAVTVWAPAVLSVTVKAWEPPSARVKVKSA